MDDLLLHELLGVEAVSLLRQCFYSSLPQLVLLSDLGQSIFKLLLVLLVASEYLFDNVLVDLKCLRQVIVFEL